MSNEHGHALLPLGRRLLERAASREAAPAITSVHESITFAALAHQVRCAAAALSRNGITPGARYAILSRNSSTILELIHASSLAGAVLVPLNFRLAPREIAEIVDDCGAELVFVEDEWLPLLDELDRPLRIVRVSETEQTNEYVAWRGDAPMPVESSEWSHHPSPDDVVLQMYTTGTTGRPKGVMLTETNLSAMATKVPQTFMFGEGDRYLALLPMFHISGGGTPVSVLAAGGQVVLSSGTSSAAILDDLATHAITHVNLVPSLISLLLADPATAAADLSALRVLMFGAAPSSDTTIAEAMALLPRCAFLHGYGLTECTGGVAYAEPHRHGDEDHWPGSVGTASPGCELRIVDPDTMRDVAPGTPGEVWVRSEQNTIGYWNRPEETARLFADGEWLRTGDIGVMNEQGVLHLKDRLKDMIISGGENVYSAEVENAVAAHPAVLEVAVYGIPDDKWGEVVKAAVTLRPGHAAEPAEIISFVRDRLAHYKCPKVVEILAELPKSGSGKILKRVLRDADR